MGGGVVGGVGGLGGGGGLVWELGGAYGGTIFVLTRSLSLHRRGRGGGKNAIWWQYKGIETVFCLQGVNMIR